MDLSTECRVHNDVQRLTVDESNVCSPIGHGSRCRAKLAEVIDYGGQQRKVRQLSEILMNVVPSKERVVATKVVSKRGRGRPKTKNADSDRIVNGPLSDSDFINKNKSDITRGGGNCSAGEVTWCSD
ncbi:hypothetical protein V6N13_106683 [Hibiscus sabdariffa]